MDWTFTTAATSGVSTNLINSAVTIVEAAAAYWGRYIDFDGSTLDIEINFLPLGGTTLAQAGPFYFYQHTDGGHDIYQAGPVLELQSGSDPNGAQYDISIDINSTSLTGGEFYLDLDDPIVSSGQFDLFTVILHEIGHGLGILSFQGDPTGDLSVYDQFLDTGSGYAYFIGPNTSALSPTGIKLVSDDWSHINSDLMEPFLSEGFRGYVSEADIEILADIGLPILRPTAGDDVLYGFRDSLGAGIPNYGYDYIELLDGHDYYQGLSGDDTVYGGGGNDTIDAGDDRDELHGDAGNDVLMGGDDWDDLNGDAGNDTLMGGEQRDNLYGGAGDDFFYDFGDNAFYGGDDFDTVSYADGASGVYIELYDSGSGTGTGHSGPADGAFYSSIESVIGTPFDDTVSGGLSNDLLDGGNGDDTLSGDDGDDTLDGGDGNDALNGGAGADALDGGFGDDALDGGGDNDSIEGWAGRDEIYGGDGDDILHGYGSHDSLYGGNNNDDLRGGHGKDLLNGSGGDDILRGFDGDDRLFGGGGADTLLGNEGNDSLTGGGDADRLKGDDGDDTLNGRFGADTVTGGAGDDLFEFRLGHGADTYDDFVAGAGTDDAIMLIAFGTAFDTFAEVIAAASDNGTHTTIDFGAGDTIMLLNVLVADLHEDDFMFS